MRYALSLCALLGAVKAYALEPFPANQPGVEIGSFLSSNFEPSGSAWHTRLNQLFVCGDNGRIARMNADGSATVNTNLAGNWEGLAIADPASNFIYIVNETNARITEYNFQSASATRVFQLSTAQAAIGVTPLDAQDIEALIDSGDNRGVESLTFVPNAADPEGGEFYAGSQENGFIYRFRLSLSAGTSVTYLGKFKTWPAGDNDLSGLDYDPARGVLIAVWDASNVIRVMSASGVIFHTFALPAGSNDEEGIALSPSALFIARDPAPASEVWRYDAPMFSGDAILRAGFESP
jgi:hypothetical protein